jgi:opacity protein-like surface antigen
LIGLCRLVLPFFAAAGSGLPPAHVRSPAASAGINPAAGALVLAGLLLGLLSGLQAAGAEPLPPLPGPADPKGPYVSLGAGASWPQPIHYDDNQLGPLLPIQGTVLADPGFSADVGLGYDFGRWRTELSYVHRQAMITSSQWTVGPFPLAAAVADPVVSSNSVFASLYLDLPVKARLVPYVGGGLGYSVVKASATTISLRGVSQSFGGGNNGTLVYQAKAGLSFRASPRSDLFSEVVFQGAPGRSNGSLERSALSSWGLRLGWRFRFGSLQAGAPASTTP